MATLPIDTTRYAMICTGKVSPVSEWSDGKPTGQQARDANTGMPLWNVDVLVDDDADRSTVASVVIGSLDEPRVRKLAPIAFVGLTANVYVNRRTQALTLRFSADAVAGAVAEQKAA